MKPKAVLILSGGLDSTVLLYARKDTYDLHCLSFDYGQRHNKELSYAMSTCDKLEIPHSIIDIDLNNTFNNALTDMDQKVPEGHYAQENMVQTIVPSRNAFMLSIAWGYAVSIRAESLMIAAHAGDHAIYPDCRNEFFAHLNRALRTGTKGLHHEDLGLEFPLLFLSKRDIVDLGVKYGVPFQDTWSCYKGEKLHCGRCGTCVERLEAFHLAGVVDPTRYEDSEYWKGQVSYGA
jgi:7-cyano-7-deazaguanine synthase